MVINGLGTIQPTSRAPRRSTQGFALPEEPTTQQSAATAPSTAADGLAVLLEQDDTEQRDRAARRRGEAALEALARLHLALLGGAESPEALARLEQLATLPGAADPRLDAILRAIGTRAAVELARRRPPRTTVR